MRRIVLHHCRLCDADDQRDRDLAARIDADNARIRTELTARLDRLDDTHIDAALHWLAHECPDAVLDALNEIGAPE